MARLFAILVGAFFALYGLAFSLAPSMMFHLVTGSEMAANTALIDVRATYGGMTLAVGLVIGFLAARNAVKTALATSAVVLFSMAVTRTVGFLVEGSATPLMLTYLGLELLGGVWSLMLMRSGQNPVPHA